MEITLNFTRPLSLIELEKEPTSKSNGIYIWGFKYPNDNKFIPYYVGKASSKGIIDRIKEHIKDIKKPESTYTRLSEDFMKSFYLLEALDKVIKSTKQDIDKPSWFDNFKNNEIEYINARWFIDEKNRTKSDLGSKNYPISFLKNPINDFLKKNIDKIYISYAIPEPPDAIPMSLRENLCHDFYEYLETITSISLKGYTFGKKEKKVNGKNPEFNLNYLQYSVDILNKNKNDDDLFYLFKRDFNEENSDYFKK